VPSYLSDASGEAMTREAIPFVALGLAIILGACSRPQDKAICQPTYDADGNIHSVWCDEPEKKTQTIFIEWTDGMSYERNHYGSSAGQYERRFYRPLGYTATLTDNCVVVEGELMTKGPITIQSNACLQVVNHVIDITGPRKK
jgi:hypothetical protein